jgi:hypothetical protein
MGIFSAAARRARENTKEEETSKYRSYNKIYMSKGYEFASAFPILMKLMLFKVLTAYKLYCRHQPQIYLLKLETSKLLHNYSRRIFFCKI